MFLQAIMSAEHLFQSVKLNTAVDSDVAYDGAKFNSICCKKSQSVETFFIQWIRVSLINAFYLAHMKCDL